MLRISIISPFTSKKIRAFVQRWWWSIVSALPLKPPPAITLPTFIINTHSVQFLFDLVKEKYQVARFVLKHKLIFKNTNFWSCTVASKRMSRTWLSGPHRFFFEFQGVFNQEEYPKCTLLSFAQSHGEKHVTFPCIFQLLIQFWLIFNSELWYCGTNLKAMT